ncbi:MAG: Flp pilus assembly complex ATPase component TadA, partial [Immundisolibacteraceae bacterium]|nr:Flp pilus assembly complex ATPase component TadA [Immundisolibacteraceae bacterium]
AELNTPNRKIITVEDPVEYRLPRVNQVQVNQKVGLDFSRFLRAALRLDPDVILVGEIRDLETAQSALRASLTGHLVMSTLHTNDAISTTLRLMDMGLESYLIASAINCIVAQRLIRQICDRCQQPASLSDGDRIWLQATIDSAEFQCFEGAGCNQCNDTGYRGRVGVYELLRFDEPMMDALRNEDQTEFSRLALNSDSYHPIIDHCIEKLRNGTTTVSEVMRLTGSFS